VVFRLDHGGEVDADGNCLFTAARTVAASKADARELRHRAVRRVAEVYTAAGEDDKAAVDAAVRHLYAPPCTSSLISTSKGTTTHGSALARCSLLAQIFYLIFSPDLASELAARWPDAGKTKMEETGLLFGSLLEKGGFGCVTLCLYVTQMLGIGLVFAFSRWRQS